VLFENVALSKADAVRALRIRLWESAYIQKTSIGHLVASLELQDLKESNRRKRTMSAQEANDTILAILMLVPNLSRFTFRGWATGQTDLLVLMRAAGTSLTKLDIYVEADYDGVFPVLNAFPHLSTLRLSLGPSSWEHSHSHPLCHQGLTHATWKCEGKDPDMLCFLSRCVFGLGCALTLVLPYVDSATVHLLNPLFEANTFHELNFHLPTDGLALLNPIRIMATPKVIFDSFFPPACLLDGPHVQAKITIAGIDNYGPPKLYGFFAMLKTLEASPARSHDTPVAITLTHLRTPPFSWTEDRFITMRVAPSARALVPRNILLLDHHGRTVMAADMYQDPVVL
jgi:hypothetical protein